MKSILALLVLVAVCNAAISKSGGLKGSWATDVEFLSTLDIAAPMVDYDGSSDFLSYTAINVTNWSAEDYQGVSASFAITNEDDSWYYTGGVSVTFWSGADSTAPDNTIEMSYCTMYTDNSVYCYFYVYTGLMTADYMPMITAWDMVGNWAVYDNTDFTDTDRPAVLSVAGNTPDTTAPTLTAGDVSATTVVLGASTSYSNAEYVDVSVTVDDHADNDATSDPNASGVADVWVVIADSDDVETSYMMILDTYSSSDSSETWGLRFAFPNWADLGTWNVARFTAVDNAGNWAGTDGAGLPSDTDVVVSWSSDNDDEVTSCQTLEWNELSSNLDTEGAVGYGYASFTLTCTEKYSGSNYGYITYNSPEYLAVGDTQKSVVNVGSYGYYGLQGVTTGDVDSSPSFYAPGQTMTLGITSHLIYVYPGNAGTDEGDGAWTLYEVITVTDSGAAQRYNADDGAASAIAPSIIAVIVAALFAMLRL